MAPVFGITGIACFVLAGYWLHPIIGLVVLGAFLCLIAVALGETK